MTQDPTPPPPKSGPTITGTVVGSSRAAPPPPPPKIPTGRTRSFPRYLPVLYALGAVIVIAGLVWMWEHPPIDAATPEQVAALKAQVDALQARVASVEQRPQPRPADLSEIEKRIAALEQQKPPAPPPPVDLGPLQARIATLERQKPPAPTDVGPILGRLDALEKRPAPDAVTHAEMATLSGRIDAVAGREDQISARQADLDKSVTSRLDAAGGKLDDEDRKLAALDATVAGRLGELGKGLATLEGSAGASAKQIAAVGDRAARVGRLQAAQAALDAGRPLGDIAGAPPALGKYATAAPPTQAALRLSFPAAVHAAQDAAVASAVDTTKTPAAPGFWGRVTERAQSLVTVREGDRVIVGDPSAGIIAHARQALDAGDLSSAVSVLGGLSGPPAQAFAGWRAQAQALLDARAALAQLAAAA